ncbi:MAG: DUF4921 family protein [Solirubrobacterales bacterium]
MSLDSPDTPEVRIDPLTGLRVLVAGARAGRPGAMPEFSEPAPLEPADDPFAEGNESMTPPEVWADRPGGRASNGPGWRVRSVTNMYPALVQAFAGDAGAPAAGTHPAGTIDPGSGPPPDPLGAMRGMPQLLASGPAFGAHEVIVNSPRGVRSLAQLTLDELEVTIQGWAARIATHRDNPEVAYVHLCVNERAEAGASLPHSHSQLYALPFVPALVARERERMRAYFEQTQGRNLAEDLLIEEVRGGERLVAIDDDAALIAPYASATPYRLNVVPRRPEARFELSEHRGTAMLHRALNALTGLFGQTPPLNLWIRTAPADAESFGWRIEIVPRIGQPAGMELGTGVSINSMSPEKSASELRDALAAA